MHQRLNIPPEHTLFPSAPVYNTQQPPLYNPKTGIASVCKPLQPTSSFRTHPDTFSPPSWREATHSIWALGSQQRPNIKQSLEAAVLGSTAAWNKPKSLESRIRDIAKTIRQLHTVNSTRADLTSLAGSASTFCVITSHPRDNSAV